MHYKTALITGGTKGIGYSIVESLLKAGLSVTFTARRSADVAEAVQELSKLGQVQGIVADVKDYNQLEEAVAKHLAAFGSLDVLIANAGVGRFAPITELTLEQWHDVIDTNLTGVFYTVKAALPALIEAKGYIVNISSLAGKNPFAGGTAYNASKFGLNGFSEALMLDVRKQGIKVTQIMPGSVATYFNQHTPSSADSWKIQPEDIAQIVTDLLGMNPRTLPSKVEVRPSQPK